MRIFIKYDQPLKILMLILTLSLSFAGMGLAEPAHPVVNKPEIKPAWYKNGEYGAVYYGGDGHIITAVCDTKYGNLIYTIKFQDQTDVKVIKGGCPTDSRDYKSVKDEQE